MNVCNLSLLRSCLILVPGNLSVMIAAVCRKEIRTARNVLIFSLALSDLLFTLSIPFTFMDAVNRSWNFAPSIHFCR